MKGIKFKVREGGYINNDNLIYHSVFVGDVLYLLNDRESKCTETCSPECIGGMKSGTPLRLVKIGRTAGGHIYVMTPDVDNHDSPRLVNLLPTELSIFEP